MACIWSELRFQLLADDNTFEQRFKHSLTNYRPVPFPTSVPMWSGFGQVQIWTCTELGTYRSGHVYMCASVWTHADADMGRCVPTYVGMKVILLLFADIYFFLSYFVINILEVYPMLVCTICSNDFSMLKTNTWNQVAFRYYSSSTLWITAFWNNILSTLSVRQTYTWTLTHWLSITLKLWAKQKAHLVAFSF